MSGAFVASRGPSTTSSIAAALLALVFAAVIWRQTSGRGPPIWTIFVAGAFAYVALGVLSVPAGEQALAASAPTLVFLFCLFLFAGALDQAGVMDHLARWIIGRAVHPADLPLYLFLGVGIVSAFVVNDALVIIGVPLLIGIARRIGANAKALLLTLAFSVTVGSTLTPFGNPQNLIVALETGLPSPVAVFLRYLAVPTALNLLLGALYVRWAFRRQMPSSPIAGRLPEGRTRLFPTAGWGRRLLAHPVLWIFPGTLLVLVTLGITQSVTAGPAIPVWEIALAGVVLLLLLSPGRSRTVQRVNWTILILFAGLFVVVAGAVGGGVIPALDALVPIAGPSHPLPGMVEVVVAALGGSQLVSNVPWVALQIPVLNGLGYGGGTPVVWMALAAGSTLAGNVTLLGAVSNLIVVDSAEKLGVKIHLREFVRYGLPLTALSVLVLVGCLALGL